MIGLKKHKTTIARHHSSKNLQKEKRKISYKIKWRQQLLGQKSSLTIVQNYQTL